MASNIIGKRRLQWMLLLRVILVTTLLGSALTVQIVYSDAPTYRVLYFFIGFTYLFTIFYGLFYKLLSAQNIYVYIQLVIDTLMITMLVYFTGGIESRYKLLYTIPIIAGAMLLSRKGALTLAITSFSTYGLLLNFLFYEILDDPSGITMRMIPLSTLVYDMFYHLLVFTLIAVLIGYLAEAQKRTGRTLEKTSVKLDDLIIFNRNVIDSMKAGLLTTDMNGWIVSFNRLAGSIAKDLGKKLKDEKIADVIEIDDKEFKNIRDKLYTESIHSLEKSILSREKDEITLSFNITPLPNSRGEIVGFIFSFQDVTEMRYLEEQLKMKEKMAALGSMAASIAHEIRNPLAAISGSAQELGSGDDLPEHDKALMGIIVKEVRRLNKTISHYLNYTQPHPFNPGRIDIQKALDDTIALVKKDPLYDKSRHQVKVKYSPLKQDYIGDSDALMQVFWNVILNSIQAMSKKGILSVSVNEALSGENGVLMKFADEGDGIPRGKREEVLQPFVTFNRGGFGLGLSIVYKIVNEHKGRITLSNNLPRGTLVTIFLPYLSVDDLT